jgi:hypothetical protein
MIHAYANRKDAKGCATRPAMSAPSIDTVFIVGAGFSHHAGLPLTTNFTEALLEARQFGRGPSRMLVDFLSDFIFHAFGHSRRARAKYWPDLEDLFTCVDLSANTGHHLGSRFSPADLRTVRRALLSRTIRMLEHHYELGRRKKTLEWRRLEESFWEVNTQRVGFISMNWDTVIERKLSITRENLSLDYCCDALPAQIPDLPDPTDFASHKKFLAAIEQGQCISVAALPLNRKQVENTTPIVKIHGSANWLYCDNCRQVFWFHPEQSSRIADQLIRGDDWLRIQTFLAKRHRRTETSTLTDLVRRTHVTCLCSSRVALGTRIATFSFRKALEFPMLQRSWFAAEEILRAASRWIFIGYSLPAADYEFKYLLKRTQLSRSSEPQFVIISGGTKKDLRRTFDNYQRFFGRAVKRSCFFDCGLTREAIIAARG